MKIKILTTALAMALASTVFADVVYNFTTKEISMYGSGLKQDEIKITESPEGIKFAFTGEQIEDNNQKAIQIYNAIYKLTPGKYNLKFRIKGTPAGTQFTAHFTGKLAEPNAPNIKIGEFKSFTLTGEWQDAVLPFEIEDKLVHGYFILRVGKVPNGAELTIAPTITHATIE